ncbi:MAG: PLP-dependent aminotransferase family protein [Rhodobacteraceae bacterium]|nr:PLP-dependent aminotransferase family protein [Paracoccaceae bacterium]
MQDWLKLYASRADHMQASEIRELLKLLDQPDMISFAGGIPDPSVFPAKVFQEVYAELFENGEHATALQYSVSEGYEPLRRWIADYMAKGGVDCSPENILITNGAQQGLDYLGKLFLSPGDTALVGWPTYLGALQAFNAYEPNYDRLLPGGNRKPEDYRDLADARGGKVKFAYTSADFANPTGETLSIAERQSILRQAQDLDIALVEDAAYQALRFDGESLPSILALEMQATGDINACRTIYCGSFSKTISPGLRVGWVCASRTLIDKLVLLKQASDLNSSTINQMVMHRVAERCFDDQVSKVKAVYKQRRDAMLHALERYMPSGVHWSHPEGGMFLWLQLDETVDAGALLKRSLQEIKVAFVPGAAFFADGSGKNCLRLNFTSCPPETIEIGISKLATVIEQSKSAAA